MPNYTNYELRSEVLKFDEYTSLLKHINLASKVDYCIQFKLPLPEDYNPKYFHASTEFYKEHYPEYWKEGEKIIKSNRERVRRLRNKLDYLISNFDAHFITFDFNDNFLNSTITKTRRRYISRFLNSLNTPYVANVDYGSENGREHYHAVIGCKVPKDKLYEYIFTLNYGGLKSLRIRKNGASPYKLSKYITKLTNHSVKETCKRCSLLYSRKYPLPSSSELVASMLGNTPLPEHSTHNTQITSNNTSNRKYKTLKLKQSFIVRQFTKRCTMCDKLIVDKIENLPYYTLTRENLKTMYFCPDCIKKYKIVTDTPVLLD